MAFQSTSYDLLALQSALSGGDDKTIEQLHAKHSSMLKSPLHQANPQLDMIPTDHIADKLLPNTETTYRPLPIPADRNFFINAVFLLLTGSFALAETLRLLTAFEIRRGDINYLLHPMPETSMALPCNHQWETHMSMLISGDSCPKCGSNLDHLVTHSFNCCRTNIIRTQPLCATGRQL